MRELSIEDQPPQHDALVREEKLTEVLNNLRRLNDISLPGIDIQITQEDIQKVLDLERAAAHDRALPTIGTEIETYAIHLKKRLREVSMTEVALTDSLAQHHIGLKKEIITQNREFILPPTYTSEGQWLYMRRLAQLGLIPSEGLKATLLTHVHAHLSISEQRQSAILEGADIDPKAMSEQTRLADLQKLVDLCNTNKEFRGRFGIADRERLTSLITIAYMPALSMATRADQTPAVLQAVGMPRLMERRGYALGLHLANRIKPGETSGVHPFISDEVRTGVMAGQRTRQMLKATQHLFSLLDNQSASLRSDLREYWEKYPHMTDPLHHFMGAAATNIRAHYMSKLGQITFRDEAIALVAKYTDL